MANQAWIIGLHQIPAATRWTRVRQEAYGGMVREIDLNEGIAYQIRNIVVQEDDKLPRILTREQFHAEFEWVNSETDAEEAAFFGDPTTT